MIDWILKYWVEFLFGLIIGALGFLYKKTSKKVMTIYENYNNDRAEQKLLKSVISVLLSDRITQYWRIYCKDNYCSPEALREITVLYTHYAELNGSDRAVDSFYNDLVNLPHRRSDSSPLSSNYSSEKGVEVDHD